MPTRPHDLRTQRTARRRPAASAGPASPVTMTFDSQLIEGFLQSQGILVDPPSSAARPMDVFVNANGQSEALIIQNGNVMHVCREPLSDSGWNVYGLGAGLQAIAGVDSSAAWAVDTDNCIWQNTLGRWTAAPAMPAGSPLPQDVSVGLDGTVWAIAQANAANETGFYQYDAATQGWALLTPQAALTQAPLGTSQSAWAVSTDGSLWNWQNQNWTGKGTPAGDTLSLIAYGLDGSVWAGSATQAAIYQYDPSSSSFTSMAGPATSPGPLLSLAAVSGGSGTTELWCVDRAGQLWHYPPGEAAWQQVTGPFTLGTPGTTGYGSPQVSIGSDGTVWLADGYGVAWKLFAGSWMRQMTPTGIAGYASALPASEVLAAADGQGTQHAFFIVLGDPAQLYHCTLGPAGWSLPDTVTTSTGASIVSGLGKTTVQAGTPGPLVVSGVSADGDLVVVTAGDGTCTATEYHTGKLAGTRPMLTATDDTWLVIAVIDNLLQAASGDASNPIASTFAPVKAAAGEAPSNAASVLALPWVPTNAGEPVLPYAGMLDADQQLWMVFGIDLKNGTGSYVQLSGNGSGGSVVPPLGIQATGTFIDSNGLTSIYAADQNDQLWVLRQTPDTSFQGVWSFDSWHPLGDSCVFIAHGPGNLAATELWLVDDTLMANQLLQQPATLVWVDQPILKPADAVTAPYYVAQYVTEVSVVDASEAYGGNPVPGAPVTLSACEPVAVWVGGTQYQIGPGAVQTLTADSRGKITVSTVALGLHTPQLTFNADGMPAPLSVYPPQIAQGALATITSGDLQAAQSQSAPTWQQGPAPLVPSSSYDNTAPAAQALNDTATVQTRNGITGGTIVPPSAPSPAALTPQALRRLWSAKVIEVRPLQAAAGADPALLGSFWDDIAKFAYDLYHAIKKAIITVTKVVVEEGALQLWLALESVGSSIVTLAIETIHDVEGAFVSAFQWVEATVEKVIDFLKELFDWQDIINTKTAIEWWVSQLLANATTTLQDPALATFLKGRFSSLTSSISKAIADAESTFSGNSFSQVAAANAPSSNPTPMQPAKATGAYGSNQVKCNAVHTQTQTYVQQGGTLSTGQGSASLAAVSGSIDQFITDIQNSLGPGSAFGGVLAGMPGPVSQSLSSPKALLDMAVVDVLKLVNALVDELLKVAEQLLLDLIALGAGCLSTLAEILETPINIPIISWIYQEITHHELTILDLLCLVIALPTTVIYKIVFGGGQAPFSSSDMPSGTLAWPAIPGSSLTPPRAGAPTALHSETLQFYEAVIYLVTMIVYAALDATTDAMAAAAAASPEAPPDPLATIFSYIMIFLALVTQAMSAPYSLFNQPGLTTAEQWWIAFWALCFVPLIVNVVFAVAGNVKAIAKLNSQWGLTITFSLGLLILLLAFAAATELFMTGDTEDILLGVQDIVASIPSAFKFLVTADFLGETEGVSLPVLMALDIVCDVANGGLGCAEDLVQGSDRPGGTVEA